jgi:hypothetical protein
VTKHAAKREAAASVAQYLLLGGFAAVAAGISAQGLTGFARDNMGLRGPWPYLLFLALDGAAGVCAVLLTRRAARAESGLAPRLAVWGLVAASASFNWTHAPHRPGSPEAFGLMPVIGAILFEFTLRELRVRSADRADRQLAALRWVHPAERVRVQLRLAADDRISAETATRHVRVDQAARRLYQLRLDEIEAAGLAKPSSRGTLIDRFRDRVMLPVHDERGAIAGFIGRAHPDAGPDVPKYLNSPETAGFRKGSLLFGLHRARPALAKGAMPVIVEGPFDAIAVNLADPGRHAGLAPGGTALTIQQASLLSQAADLPRSGILVAFDSDAAGRKAAARAYGILRPHTPKLQSAQLNAKDPAQILQQDGPEALRAILREHREPLSAVVIDIHIAGWERHLTDTEGRYRAMRSVAALIAGLLPEDTATQVRQLTEGRDLVMLDDELRPVENPQLLQIVSILPPDTTFQVVRAASTLGFDVSDVTAEVANAANRSARSPKGQGRRVGRDDPGAAQADRSPPPPRLASASFPCRPFIQPVGLRLPNSQAGTGLPRSRPRSVHRAP